MQNYYERWIIWFHSLKRTLKFFLFFIDKTWNRILHFKTVCIQTSTINCFKSQCRNIIPIAKAVAGEAASPNTCVNDTHLGGLQLVPHEAPRGGNCYGQ